MTDVMEEYEIWKVNAPYIYNLMSFDTLDWPSFTCQWLPDIEEKDDCKISKLIMGTHTDEEENKLIITEYKMWNNKKDETQVKGKEGPGFSMKGKFEVKQLMSHKGDVNRARYMPQNSSVIATRSSEKESYVYKGDQCILTLKGHSEEGYGLSWSPHKEGRLLTCSFDKTICCWDMETANMGELAPSGTMASHTDKVEDVAWHPRDQDVFASVGDDKKLLVWDCRTRCSGEGSEGPSLSVVAHDGDVNCVAWHPITEQLVLTGGSDETVCLWDRRRLVKPLHTFVSASNVYRLAWAPLQETLFLSAGLDRKVSLWDLERIGNEVLSHTEEDDTYSELVMMHAGHTDSVTDLDWHPHEKSTVASVAEDNMVNVWQIVGSILEDD